MSDERDARPERQSSWPRAARYARVAFASFVLVHLALQAFRAASETALPEPRFEQTPWVMGLLLLFVWLPFTWHAGRELGRARRNIQRATSAEQRALAWLDPGALGLVLLFSLQHGLEFAGGSLTGALAAEDVRAELVRSLSSTHSGLPLVAAVMLCAVGAASFCAVRQTLASWPRASPRLVRLLVLLGVGAYLLGSYAIIRGASGTLWD